MILNSSETSGPLSNDRIKMCSLEVYIKSFGGQKGGLLEPPGTPPPPPLPTGLIATVVVGNPSKQFIRLQTSFAKELLVMCQVSSLPTLALIALT